MTLTAKQNGTIQYFAGLAYGCGIPEHMQEGIGLYVAMGIEPGGFLRFIFENDFVSAAGKADDHNQLVLWAYCKFLHNHAPRGCWGSPKAVQGWIELGGTEGWEASQITPLDKDHTP